MRKNCDSLIGSTAAIINGFIAVVVAQFFKDRPAARVLLVLAAGVLGGAAIGATLLGQHEAIIQKAAQQARLRETRDTIGKFMTEGSSLVANLDKSTPPDQQSLNAWATRVVEYVRTRLGQSYADRVLNSAGVPIVACNGADDAHNKMFRIVSALNQLRGRDSPAWPIRKPTARTESVD